MCVQAAYLVNLVNGSNPVPDSSLTASSTLVWASDDFRPRQGRLYNQYQTFASGPYTKAPGIWAPATANANQFIQVSYSILMYSVNAMKTVNNYRQGCQVLTYQNEAAFCEKQNGFLK